MPTEIRISKHNALYQASIQLEELDYTKLYRAYSGIRKSQIEPRVLFKVLVCAYMKGVYSSRKIEELCRENLVFRWLLEDQKTPDHCTIARFRGNRNLQEAFEDLFFQYVKKLENKGYTEHSEVFVDGTKIESKANRYTFVWLKQVSKQLEKIKARLKERVCPQGNLTSTKVEKRLEQLNTEIEAQGIEVKKGRGHHKPEIVRERDELALLYRRWMEYNRKKAICGENRNSYSKTDTDATFMHMKDDHMRNGQLKPGYNVQFAVNSGFITGIGVFSNRTDFGTLIPFLTYLWHKHGKSYRNVVADSGYESLANYRWLFENGQTAFIKPANYESGKKRSSKSQVGRMENMGYYEPDDCFICKNGRHLDLSSHYTSHAKDGTERKISVYRCEDCSGCPYRTACCKAKDSEKRKEIFVCWEFQNLRKNSYHNITTEEGKLLRCNRSIQAEGAFGQLKHNRNFKRFLTGGKVKVLAELQVRYRIVMAAEMHKVNDRHGDAVFLHSTAEGIGQLPLGVQKEVGGAALQGIRFYKEAGLTAAGTADHNNVQIPLVPIGIIAEADILGKNDFLPRVLAVAVAFVQLFGNAPMGRAVFLAGATVRLIEQIAIHPQRVEHQDRQQKFRGAAAPTQAQRVIQQRSKPCHQS